KQTRESVFPGDATAGTIVSDSPLTSSGMAVGTPSYMSPEQARGEEVDLRSDLFSFGTVLYEASTGRKPFSGPTTTVVFEAILNRGPSSPQVLKADLPPAFCDIVNKLLDKEKELRYQSASELRTDLRRLERELGGGSSAKASSALLPTRAQRRRAVILG